MPTAGLSYPNKYFLAFFNAIFGFLKVFLILFFFIFQNSFLSFSKLFGPPHIMDIFSIKEVVPMDIISLTGSEAHCPTPPPPPVAVLPAEKCRGTTEENVAMLPAEPVAPNIRYF